MDDGSRAERWQKDESDREPMVGQGRGGPLRIRMGMGGPVSIRMG